MLVAQRIKVFRDSLPEVNDAQDFVFLVGCEKKLVEYAPTALDRQIGMHHVLEGYTGGEVQLIM